MRRRWWIRFLVEWLGIHGRRHEASKSVSRKQILRMAGC